MASCIVCILFLNFCKKEIPTSAICLNLRIFAEHNTHIKTVRYA